MRKKIKPNVILSYKKICSLVMKLYHKNCHCCLYILILVLLSPYCTVGFINHKQNIKFPTICTSDIKCDYSKLHTLVLNSFTCPDNFNEAEDMSLINVQAICELRVSWYIYEENILDPYFQFGIPNPSLEF